MTQLRAWWHRMRGMFGKRTGEDFSAEVECHLQMHIEDNLRAGMSPEEARRDALIKSGGVEQAKQAYRERESLPWLETLWQDIRFGLRMLCKRPVFTTVAVLTLALGIGANTAIFSFVDALFLKPLAVSRPEELVRVYAKGPSGHYGAGFSYPEFRRMHDHGSSFAALSVETERPQLHLVTGSGSEEIRGEFVSSNYFRLLGIQPRLGREFLPEEDTVPDRDALPCRKTTPDGESAACILRGRGRFGNFLCSEAAALDVLRNRQRRVPSSLRLNFDWSVLVYLMALALVTGTLFGLVPSVRASRQNLVTELKEGGAVELRTRGWLARGGRMCCDVLRLVVGQRTKLAFIGVVTGVIAALISTHLLSSLLFGVNSSDPITYICVTVLPFLVAPAACYFPARRAMRVDPVQALRTE